MEYYHLSQQAGSASASRKSTDPDFDVLREFKRKLEEDGDVINFFNERIRIEQQYIDSLSRLYAKTVGADTVHDDPNHRIPRSSTKSAWTEVRDYTQREIECRESLIHALRQDVMARLVAVRETHSRIRQRNKENLKAADEAYEEQYRAVPKLQKAYRQKSQALDDHRRQEHAVAMQAKLLSETSPSPSPSHEKPHPFSPPTVNPPLPPSSNPAQTSPEHLFPSNASVGFSTQTTTDKKPLIGRNRAGSGSGIGIGGDSKPKEVLSDIAAQGKKGFSAIMQRLGGDKAEREKEEGGAALGDEVPNLQRRGTGSAGSAKVLSAQKGIKAKREADEADKAYRLGIFHLETLRRNRERYRTLAVQNLQEFNDELNAAVVESLGACVTALHATGVTLAQATDVAQNAIDIVNLEADAALYRSKLPAPSAERTAPVLYENYYVGPCRSLIFGINLTDYDFARGEGGDHGRPPLIVEKCIDFIDARIETEGLYRISGRQTAVQQLVFRIEQDEAQFQFTRADDVHIACSILKQYLRDLPEPVFPFAHAERVKYTENREAHISSEFSALRARLRRLQPIQQTTFQAIVEHLGRVNAHAHTNKMDARLFSPTGEQAPGVLPPGTALSRSGVKSYHPVDDGPHPGSSRTRIRIVNLNDDSPAASQVDLTSSPASSRRAGVEKSVPALAVTSPKEFGNTRTLPVLPFTPDHALVPLFDPDLIPSTLKSGVGDDLHVRPLASDDFLRSHFGLLSTLATAPALAPSFYLSRFRFLQSCPDTYFIVVVVSRETDQLFAAGTLIVEQKFIHAAGKAGHIEDIVVSPEAQGRGLGAKLVKGLREMADALGCYKTILDCKEDKTAFYEKCGFHLRGRQMAYYRPDTIASVPSPSRDTSYLHAVVPEQQVHSPPEGAAAGGADEADSASDTLGVTYHFPIDLAGLTPLVPVSPIGDLSFAQQQAQQQARGEQERGDKGETLELGHPARPSEDAQAQSGTASPLPPGAAAPALGTPTTPL
ncbi:hypothetical protein Q5752_004368 [Cryptotrichosporon argae]